MANLQWGVIERKAGMVVLGKRYINRENNIIDSISEGGGEY